MANTHTFHFTRYPGQVEMSRTPNGGLLFVEIEKMLWESVTEYHPKYFTLFRPDLTVQRMGVYKFRSTSLSAVSCHNTQGKMFEIHESKHEKIVVDDNLDPCAGKCEQEVQKLAQNSDHTPETSS